MRQGTMQAGVAITTADAQTTAYSELAAADKGRLGLGIHNPSANGVLTLSWDGVLPYVEIAAGGYFEVPDFAATIQLYGKVTTNGTVNVTAFR